MLQIVEWKKYIKQAEQHGTLIHFSSGHLARAEMRAGYELCCSDNETVVELSLVEALLHDVSKQQLSIARQDKIVSHTCLPALPASAEMALSDLLALCSDLFCAQRLRHFAIVFPSHMKDK
jgi:hypothetical protein